MRTFVVRLMCHTKRPALDLGAEMKACLKPRGEAGGILWYEELRGAARDEALQNALWSFSVMTVVLQSASRKETLAERLLPLRNQSDPARSDVSVLELPGEDAAASFWAHAKRDTHQAMELLVKFFPWYAERVPKTSVQA